MQEQKKIATPNLDKRLAGLIQRTASARTMDRKGENWGTPRVWVCIECRRDGVTLVNQPDGSKICIPCRDRKAGRK